MEFDKLILTDVEKVYTVNSVKGTMQGIVNRKYCGLSFCMSGQITYRHKGNQVVSKPGYAVFLPKGETYTLQRDKTGIFLVINFDCIGLDYNTVVPVKITNEEIYFKEYEQIKKQLLFDRNRLKVFSILYNIFHRMTETEILHSSILEPAIRLMENRYDDSQLSNAILAEACNISEVYFRKIFTREFGVSPKQHILDIRISRAKQLLSEGGYKISAISEQCGFSNPYHFCRIFKEKVGSTPTEYMNQNRVFTI